MILTVKIFAEELQPQSVLTYFEQRKNEDSTFMNQFSNRSGFMNFPLLHPSVTRDFLERLC